MTEIKRDTIPHPPPINLFSNTIVPIEIPNKKKSDKRQKQKCTHCEISHLKM